MVLGLCAFLIPALNQAKPNILLVVADDLGYADVDFQEHSAAVVKTPHLNELAMGGVRLVNHHVQPFCSPTRATLMTGRHVLRYGLQNTVIWPQDAWALPSNETFIAQNMRSAGYKTAQFGKWHLGLYNEAALPLARGFGEQYGYYLGGEDYYSHTRKGSGVNGLDWHRNDTLCASENGTYSAVLIGNAATAFVRKHSAVDTPWFLYLPFQSVHSPMEAPTHDPPRYPALSGNVQKRAQMVSALDDAVGQLVAELKATEQLDSTVIVFTSDNGAPDGDALDMTLGRAMMATPEFRATHGVGKPRPTRPPPGKGTPPAGSGGGSNWPLSGWKHWVFEGGVRSAAFFRYPPLTAARAGSVHSGLFHSVDWLPTLVGLAGGSTTANLPLDGFDISSALGSADATASPRAEIPLQITACGSKKWPANIVDGPMAAMIVGELKLIVDCYWRDAKNVSAQHVQLYNLSSDVGEMNNLAAARPDDVARLIERLEYWENQSVEPYNMHLNASCGEGKPMGTPPQWGPWC